MVDEGVLHELGAAPGVGWAASTHLNDPPQIESHWAIPTATPFPRLQVIEWNRTAFFESLGYTATQVGIDLVQRPPAKSRATGHHRHHRDLRNWSILYEEETCACIFARDADGNGVLGWIGIAGQPGAVQ